MCFASAPDPVEPLPFNPVDIEGLRSSTTEADRLGYERMDARWAEENPFLAKGEKLSLDQSYKNLTGPLDPTVQASFVNKGLMDSLMAFGGGSNMSSIGGEGSIGKKTASTSFANSVLGKQDYDRDVFNQDQASNLKRAIGPPGSTGLNWLIKNTGDQNQVNQTNYAGSVNQSNAEQAASDANTAGTISSILAVLGIAAAV